MRISRKIVATAAALTFFGGISAATAMTADAAAPTPFPVYYSGSALVTAHQVTSGERLVVAGHPVTLASVTHPGPAYVAHILIGLPASLKGKTLAAVAEG